MPSFELSGGLSLFYRDEGQGEPLLLIHGFPLSGELFRPQRAGLSHRFRIITPDLRGMGRSDSLPAEDDYSMSVYADDMAALLDSLGIGQAIVGGMSMGGYVAFAMLRRHPERVKALILLDTKASADTAEGRQGRFQMMQQARDEGAIAIAEAMLPKMLSERARTEQPELASWLRELMAANPVDGIVGALHALAERPDSTPLLASIRFPTLVIVGGDDPITPPAVAEDMAGAIDGAELLVVEGAAHASNLERPGEVNDAIERWADGFV